MVRNIGEANNLLGIVHSRVLLCQPAEQTLREWAVPILKALSVARYTPRNSDAVVRIFYGDLNGLIQKHLKEVVDRGPVTAWFLRILRRIDEGVLRRDEYVKVLVAACRALSCTLNIVEMSAHLPPGNVQRAADRILARMLAALSPIASTVRAVS
ncbi:hypothetical protein [Streptomyces sp. NPDC051909]|uniref:hypothetical protein n=1 Tax=Streptomyces sp. NPDC051909 TaxID=3154944 RepID=UPI003435F2C0